MSLLELSQKQEIPVAIEDGVSLETIHSSSEQAEATEAKETIYGNPEADMENWHLQKNPMSCAVVCQEMIAEQLTGKEFSEEELVALAKSKGWYSDTNGTSEKDVGNILESLGLDVERSDNLKINDLKQELCNGGKIICAVNHNILATPRLAEIPGMQADHAVEVIGIDDSIPGKTKVILNDSGVLDGKGREIDLEVFQKAWNTGNNYAVFARKGVTV